MTSSCQPIEKDLFNADNIVKCKAYVLSMQRKLDKAVGDGDVSKIRYITYLLSKRSLAAKILAVHKVTSKNKGKYTAGIDGKKTPKDRKKANRFRNRLLSEIGTSKPMPIRKVLIPKPNGKMRELGIATIRDRCEQEVIRTSIEPIVERHFNDNSFGFRPKRCCQDAIELLFKKTCRTNHPQWVLEGDIRGCFDHINHQAILTRMKEWKIPNPIVGRVRSMLKTGHLTCEKLEANREGTPQGSVLSPLLANIALTALDEYGNQFTPNPIIRYADDFVLVCKSKEEAHQHKANIGKLLKEKVGVELSSEKTTITNIHDGINFLGFHICKYKKESSRSKYHQVGKLVIKPQPEKVNKYLLNCKRIIYQTRGRNLETLIKRLNPMLRGFANYYRFVCSKETFSHITNQIHWKVFRWLCKSHPNKSTRWINQTYRVEQNHLKKTKTFAQNSTQLYLPVFVPITRWVKVRKGMRVYDNNKETKEYWEKRNYENSLKSIVSVKVGKLFRQQNGKCPICQKEMTREQINASQSHLHHLLPQSVSEDDKLTNLRLIHSDCHRELHRILKIEEMERFAKEGFDYCNHRFLYHNSSNDLESVVR